MLKKCPNCNSTKINITKKAKVCRNCGYMNLRAGSEEEQRAREAYDR